MKNLLESILVPLTIVLLVAFTFVLVIAMLTTASHVQADEQSTIDEMLDRAVEMGEWFTLTLRHGGDYSSSHVSVRGDGYICLDQFRSDLDHYGIDEPSTYTYTRIGEMCVLTADIVAVSFRNP